MKTKKELEREADYILRKSGFDVPCPREFERQQSFYAHLPARSQKPIIYSMPKQTKEGKLCITCSRLISDSSGLQCSYCYRTEAQAKYRDKLDYLEVWGQQVRDIYSPEEYEVYKYESNQPKGIA